MKSRIASILAALLWASMVCSSVALAQIPKTINYQGYLTSPSGAAINNPSVSMVFKLYDAVTGGNLLHTETQTVAVSNGIFNVVLGNTTPFTASFAAPYWLSVAVGGDAEMTPRQPLAASPYALRAANADALAASATVTGSQITGAISTATLPATSLTGTLATAQLANASVTAAKLASNGCTAGQILKYDGSAWACGADTNSGGTVTSITAGTGLTGGTITATGTIGLGTVPLTNLANCSAQGDVAVMYGGAWVCRSALPRYVDNGDGTVTDNRTGLMWEQKIASNDARCPSAGEPFTGNDVRCTQNYYGWNNNVSPLTDPSGTLYSYFLQQLNGLNNSGGAACFAGYCDWRIPTIGELRSILTAQYPAACPAPGPPCIDQTKFGPTPAASYWSSSSLASDPSNAWLVHFRNGVLGYVNKGNTLYTRAVRSGR